MSRRYRKKIGVLHPGGMLSSPSWKTWKMIGGLFVEVESVEVVLFKTLDNDVYAIGNVCPHQGAPLAEGWYEQEDCVVTCPLHAWDFDVRTGRHLNGPESVPTYETRVVDGTVEVAL